MLVFSCRSTGKDWVHRQRVLWILYSTILLLAKQAGIISILISLDSTSQSCRDAMKSGLISYQMLEYLIQCSWLSLSLFLNSPSDVRLTMPLGIPSPLSEALVVNLPLSILMHM